MVEFGIDYDTYSNYVKEICAVSEPLDFSYNFSNLWSYPIELSYEVGYKSIYNTFFTP